jgi:carboxyl-terminal processing protease
MSLKLRSALVLVIGTVLGLTVSIGSSMLTESRETASAANPPLEDEYLALLAEALQRVRREYVDQIDDKTLVENAIKGMLDGLDQHSRYLNPDQYDDIRIATTGNYTGVGLDVSDRDGKLTVVAPLDNSPAARAGIQPGDVVVSVNDVAIGGDGIEAAISSMRGEPGTEVRLDVSRGPEQDLIHFSLKREPIHVATVVSESLAGGYGYIRLTGFTDSTLSELDQAAAELIRDSQPRLNGVVLDLRDNPGGVLQAAIGVADVFLDDGLIVRGNGRIRQSQFEQFAEPGGALESAPLVVLINSRSASGSEIVAGALKDHGRAQLVGERSYGKGSVQSVVPLGAGSALKLTTALYLTPSGVTINGRGIDPDQFVEFNASPQYQYHGPGSQVGIDDDIQVSRALAFLGYKAIALSQVH